MSIPLGNVKSSFAPEPAFVCYDFKYISSQIQGAFMNDVGQRKLIGFIKSAQNPCQKVDDGGVNNGRKYVDVICELVTPIYF